MRRGRKLILGASLTALAAVGAAPAGALTLPPGFQARELPALTRDAAAAEGKPEPWKSGLNHPTALAFAPGGKLFVGDWFGRVKVLDSIEDTTPTVAVDITDDVHSSGDRGLLGMKLDPEFGTAGHNYVYLGYAYDVRLGHDEEAPIHDQWVDGGDKCDYVTPSECVISGRVTRVELNPATGIAVGGAADPPQTVLVQSWCQQFNSHSMGDLEFDSDGALLVSGGEGASYVTADFGQPAFENPCGDPVDEGGSLRAQDVRTHSPSDPTDYSGSIIRIDPATGAALPDNPLYRDPANPALDNPDVRARRILAYGFRNPYRFEVRPGTDQVYVGDVGQEEWEELDRVTSPPAVGQQASNFGWPCYEGGSGASQIQLNWDALNKPLCETLYSSPGAVTASFWGYRHGDPEGRLFDGDECDPDPGAAYSGLEFYDGTGLSEDESFPLEDRGALFMADAARGCVWTMRPGPGGVPDPAQISNFATSEGDGSFTPVDLTQGPEGALYAPNFYSDGIVEIRYYAGNRPPQAALEASKVDGPIGAGFKVDFDAGGSEDPDGDTLHYAWDLDGDGGFEEGSDQPTAEMTYTVPANVTVKVRVSDGFNHSSVRALTIYPGDLGPPEAEILGPEEDLEWAIGDEIPYSGTATDPGGETVSGGQIQLHWVFNIRHCPDGCHTHPFSQADGGSGTFTAPPHEYPSHLYLELTATDLRGRTNTVGRDVYPLIVDIGIASDPAGIPVTLDGAPAALGPFKRIAGSSVAVSAPVEVTLGGLTFTFDSWSDGGDPAHEINDLMAPLSLVARYSLASGPPGGGLPPVSDSTIRLGSRPGGVRLRLGSSAGRAPLSADLAVGSETTILAPRRFHRGKRRFRFSEWRSQGHRVSRARGKGIVVGDPRRYVAVYERR